MERPRRSILPDWNTAGVRKDLREYLLTSTLHGLRYVGEKKLTWFERFFWLGAFSCSIVCAGFFILNVYAKWRMSPMIVSINSENMPLQNLPFPAITICNVNQAKKSVAERYKKSGSPVDKKLLESLCTSQDDTEIFDNDAAESADWDYTRSFLINVTQPCSEMLAMCIWDSSEMSCEDLFNAQLTDEGLCCTFNVVHRNKMFRNPKSLNDMNFTFPLPSVDWTPEGGYPANAPYNGFPWRPKGIGTDHGLTLVLDANIAEYYCASTKSPSFKILLHNPTETPNIANLGDIYGPGIETRVAIQTRISDAQPALKSIDIEKRLCLFSSEKELVFYRTYTLRNCEMECEARNMLALCKCVLYYMPTQLNNVQILLHNPTETPNIANLGDIYGPGIETRVAIQTRISDAQPALKSIDIEKRLCLFSSEKELVFYRTYTLRNCEMECEARNMLALCKCVLYYMPKNKTTRVCGKADAKCYINMKLLSNGGLLGLCMGFSMMSVVELIYYVTLRALCLARRRRPKQMFTQ
ncbi:hypothetical protein MSG28_005814 [Choristoneura fumiferana]|uniref:Uncharacterized protein n=3 Tax=Choristoneura fumiferana TaxID=7141 RepID=A0ACC0L074_CHOFU|nr:hypothetical protein MSG28_005814 [Choristoneura fumiferana]